MIFQIDEAKILEGFSHAHCCKLTQRRVTTRKTREINNRKFFTGAQFDF